LQAKATSEFKSFQVYLGSVFLVLAAFSALYSFERLYADSGYYFFQLINKQAFHVEHGRLVLFLSQSLTWIGLQLHFPLKLLVLIYSLTSVLFHFSLTYIAYKYFKNYHAAIVLCLLQFVGIVEAHFTPQFELFYGLSLLVFSYAYVKHFNSAFNWKHGLVVMLLLVFVFTSHPMAVLCFVVLYSSLLRDYKSYKKWLLYITLSLGLYVIIKKTFPSEYEKAKFDELLRLVSIGEYQKIFSFSYFFKWLKFMVANYLDVLILLGLGIYVGLKEKKFLEVTVVLLSFLLIVFLNCINLNPEEINRYIEQMYAPAVFVVLVLFLYFKLNSWTYILILLITAYRILLTIDTVSMHEKRNMVMFDLLKKTEQVKQQKFVVKDSLIEDHKEIANWSYGIESMVMSSAKLNSTKQLCLEQDFLFNDNNKKLKPNEFLFRKWEIWDNTDLNQNYYTLDTLGYSYFLNQ